MAMHKLTDSWSAVILHRFLLRRSRLLAARDTCATLIYQSVLVIACHGCHQAEVKDYIPPDHTARQALTTALDAWKSGKSPDQIGASQPEINAQDDRWTAGKKLAAYEILAAATGDDDHRRYTVKLTIEGAGPQEVTYVVFGNDPLWVVSSESYQRMSGM